MDIALTHTLAAAPRVPNELVHALIALCVAVVSLVLLLWLAGRGLAWAGRATTRTGVLLRLVIVALVVSIGWLPVVPLAWQTTMHAKIQVHRASGMYAAENVVSFGPFVWSWAFYRDAPPVGKTYTPPKGAQSLFWPEPIDLPQVPAVMTPITMLTAWGARAWKAHRIRRGAALKPSDSLARRSS